MNPLDLVGKPHALSAVLAVAFALPWLVILARQRLLDIRVWAVVVAGAVLFPLSIAWIQVPIQKAISALWLKVLSAEALQRYILGTGVPSVAVSGIVQETVKFALAVAGLYWIGQRRIPRAGLALGAAAGAGYGGMEAFWIFNQIFSAGFTWATVQLAGPAALLGFIERFFTVMFHIAVASLSAYGFATGRPWRYLLLSCTLHALTNYVVLPLSLGLLSATTVEAILAGIAATIMAAAIWLRFRPARPPSPPAAV